MKSAAVLIVALSGALWAGVVAADTPITDSAPFTDNSSAESAPAESAPAEHQATPHANFGSDTRAWFDMQSSNAQASSTSQALPGPVMRNIYKRYVDSFARPIPDKFEQFSAKTESK